MFALLSSLAFSALFAPHEEKSFISWMRRTNQIYTGEEYQFRLGIFLSNSRHVQEFNSAKKSFKLSLNKFACLTPSEYRAILTRVQKPSNNNRVKISQKGDNPAIVDWRDKGVVNGIKDQGGRGSCWAFGTVQACESAYALAHGQLNSCSEQNLVDCVTSCYGCHGGLESAALDYIIEQQDGLLISENDYPYHAIDGTCKFDKTKGINKITGYEHGKEGDEEYLATLSAKGVLDIAIDASWTSFSLYYGGIYDQESCSSTFLNHAVGLVGYGTEDGVDYWIVRNSWGQNWGEQGYVRMSRNKNNQCGVATDALLVHA